jgi:hypothetical protein
MSKGSNNQPSSVIPLLNLRDFHKSPVEPLNDTSFLSNEGLNDTKLINMFPLPSVTSPSGLIHLASLE